MSFTVGRASLPVDPSSATWNGDMLTVEGWISPAVANDTNQAYAIRQQLLGLVDNDDETVFPCTFSVDPDWDGFYTAESVRVEGRPGLMETQGRMPYTLVLRRVGGFTAPQFECIATTVTATNSHGLPTAAAGLVGVPSGYEGGPAVPVAGGVAVSFSAFGINVENGVTVGGLRNASLPTSPFRFTWATGPFVYYEASAKIERSYGGTYYPVVGQQAAMDYNSNAWRISNGIIRLSWPIGGATLSVEHLDSGTTWFAAKLFALGGVSTAVTLSTFRVARIIRNTPEEVIVRLTFQVAGSLSLDISLRRGARWAGFSLVSSITSDWYVQPNIVEAATALTGGLRATAADAAGNRYTLGGLAAQTNNLVTGRLKLTTAATTFQFCIGTEVAADGSGQSMINQFAQTVIENHRVVAR